MKKSITALTPILVLGLFIASAMSAQAAERGDWLFKATLTELNTSMDGGSLDRISRSEVYLDDASTAGLSLTRMLTNHLALEGFTAWPFSQQLSGNRRLADLGLDHFADVKQLPLGVNLQYHIQTVSGLRPYLGAGLYYAYFFDEKDRINGIHAKIDNTWGYGAQAGVDLETARNWLVNVDARYIRMDARATLSGMVDQKITMHVNPWLFSVGVGYKF